MHERSNHPGAPKRDDNVREARRRIKRARRANRTRHVGRGKRGATRSGSNR